MEQYEFLDGLKKKANKGGYNIEKQLNNFIARKNNQSFISISKFLTGKGLEN